MKRLVLSFMSILMLYSIAAAAPTGTVNTPSPTSLLTGTARDTQGSGVIFVITISEGATVLGTTNNDLNGNWSYQLPASMLTDGKNHIVTVFVQEGGFGPVEATGSPVTIRNPAPVITRIQLSTTVNPPIITWMDNSYNENGFRLEESANDGVFVQIADIPTANKLGQSVLQAFTEPATLPDGKYCWRMTAYSDLGVSQYSNTVCGVINSRPPLLLSQTISRCKFTITGTPPDDKGGWIAIFFRNGSLNLGNRNAPPYALTVELTNGLIYDFWITWIKTGAPSVNSQHLTAKCP